uniref:Uncharacterized protein LOC102804482 n=1 Tax=Saccoglossus kowalevskii TaxID=10224 RepID=A0ABM0MEK4_SACKO|nr:PREDICTED: uncharacterized protein LOC102804482 [Saccoglossus kowalevskii]
MPALGYFPAERKSTLRRALTPNFNFALTPATTKERQDSSARPCRPGTSGAVPISTVAWAANPPRHSALSFVGVESETVVDIDPAYVCGSQFKTNGMLNNIVPDIKVPREARNLLSPGRQDRGARGSICSAKSDESMKSDSLSDRGGTAHPSPLRRSSIRPLSQEPRRGSITRLGMTDGRSATFYRLTTTTPNTPNNLSLDRGIDPGRRRGSAIGLDLPSLQYLRRRRRIRLNPDTTQQPNTPQDKTVPDTAIQVSEMSLIDRFRRAANIVFVCVLLAKRGNKRTKREMKDPFGNIENTNDTFGGLAFNPSYFKANRQQRLSEEAKRILTSDRSQRTDYQLKYAQIGLRNIESFAEYPVRMQQKLCKVGWLETFEPGRCIVRQGHIAHAFYIILSGTVMVTVTDGENSRVVCFLKRGEAFGELAILNNSKRASTVISRDCVELLAISTEDFEDIFMCQGGVKNVNDPDHHEFLSSLHFLKDWPLHLLETHPTECVFNFFRRGDVLVKDSNYSDWIYIVKSGSAYVLKKLKKVKPCLRKRIYSDDDGVLSLLAGSPRNLTRINKLLSHHDDVIAGENETPRDSDDDIHKHTETSSNESGTRARNGYHNNPDSLKRKRRLIMPTSKGVYLSTTTQHTKTKSIHDKKVKKKKDKGKRKGIIKRYIKKQGSKKSVKSENEREITKIIVE